MPHDKRVQGFTLLELMVTVAIMAIMAAIAFLVCAILFPIRAW